VLVLAAAAAIFLWRSQPAAPLNYLTSPAEIGDMTIEVSATGTLQPLIQVSISSELSGIVRSVSADENQRVKKGDVLAELDTAKLRVQIERAQASVEVAEAQVASAKTSLDDSLDVIAAHGVGGTVGALLTGVFAEKALNGVADGVLFGNPKQILVQGTAVLAAIVYSGVVSFVLLKAIALVMPLRATGDEEATGLDIALHGEEAYLHDGGMEAVTPIETDIFQPVPAPAKSAAVSI